MKYNVRQRLALLLAGVLLFSGMSGFSTAFASKAQDLRNSAADARKKAAEADQKAAALKKEIQDLDAEAAKFAEQAAALAPDIQSATEKNNLLTKEFNQLQAQADALKARIEATQAELDEQQELLNNRADQTYRHGNEIYLNLLFGAESLEDLIARTDYIMQVLQYNSQISEELTRMTRTLQSEKSQLDEIVAVAAQKQQEAAANEAKLRQLQAQSKSAEANAEAAQKQKGNLMQETQANADRLRAMAAEEEAMARQIEKELSGSGSTGSGVYNGKMTWPVPGFTNVSSGYGYRIHPITGVRTMHHGIDIAGSGINGAKVVAAGPGKVISAGDRSGYGQTVIIDHGNGVTTLYAHMQAGSISVSNGQSVSAGQQVGRVGSTGNSTGPHLHWEVRVNGASRNPLTY